MNGHSMAFFKSPDECKMHQPKASSCCKKKASKASIHKDCCKEHSYYVKASTESAGPSFEWSIGYFALVQTPFAWQDQLPESGPIALNAKLIRFLNYSPPQAAPDIRVLIQSFIC